MNARGYDPDHLTDHETLEDFVRALAKASTTTSRDTGEVLNEYWKDEAIMWVKRLDLEGKP